MKIKFEDQFDESVLKQGKKCLENGAIEHIFKDEDNYSVYAEGSKDYLVNVTIQDGVCTSKSCECSSEGACQHEAALLYALQDNEELDIMDQVKKEVEKEKRIHEMLDQLSKEELIDFLGRMMSKYEDVSFAFLSLFPQCDLLDVQDYIDKVDIVIRNNSDHQGFITYDRVSSFTRDLYTLLEQVDRMVKENPRAVFNVCKYIIELLPELAIDDSNGTTYDIAEVVGESIQDIYDKDKIALMQEISEWLQKMLEDEGIVNCCLDDPLQNLYDLYFSKNTI